MGLTRLFVLPTLALGLWAGCASKSSTTDSSTLGIEGESAQPTFTFNNFPNDLSFDTQTRIQWEAFFAQKKPNHKAFQSAASSAQVQYTQAIDSLSKRMSSCRRNKLNPDWMKRIRKKFKPAALQTLEPDLRKGLSAVWIRLDQKCIENDMKAAYLAEAQFIPLAKEYAQLVIEFLESKNLSSEQREHMARLKQDVAKWQDNKESALNALLNPSESIVRAAYIETIDPRLKAFLEEDPAFQRPFNLKSAVDSLGELAQKPKTPPSPVKGASKAPAKKK